MQFSLKLYSQKKKGRTEKKIVVAKTWQLLRFEVWTELQLPPPYMTYQTLALQNVPMRCITFNTFQPNYFYKTHISFNFYLPTFYLLSTAF